MRIFVPLVLISLLAACGGAPTEPATPQTQEVPSAAPTSPEAPPSSSVAPATSPSTAPSATPEATKPQTEGAACAGHVDAPPNGFTASTEAAPSFAIGAPGKGSLCEGKVFTVSGAVTVYRLFTASYETSKRAGPLGAYWTLQKPSGKADAYRTANEICAEWNDLDMINECHIDAGAKVVLGPGQSATCQDGNQYPASTVNQLLIIKSADGKVPVSGCKQSKMTWSK